MNQTKKRLNIIKLAISITDIETIQLQVLKLAPLKGDSRIQEIIENLQAENYAKAQTLITEYIETPMEEIIQRTSQEMKKRQEEEEQATIEEFDLFVTTPQGERKEIGEKDLLDFTTQSAEESTKNEQRNIDFNSLLSIDSDEILPNNIQMNIKQTPRDTFFDTSVSEIPMDTETVPKDTFFDEAMEPSEHTEEDHEEDTEPVSDYTHETTNIENKPEEDTEPDNSASGYQAITYIEQKYRNMYTQYPPLEKGEEAFPSVNAWLLKISNDGYTEKEVEEVLSHITKLTQAKEYAEAAQLLLITGATQSKFAQFILARALYKGEILQKNIPESFTLIYRLAMDDNFPEAVCDLAQFYEHGIGIDKDKQKALVLYKEAMELGIGRAMKHFDRLQKETKGLLSIFK